MKKGFIISLSCVLLVMSSCGESEKTRMQREAGKLLRQAREELDAKQYQSARSTIEQIREGYPTAFEARKAAILTLDSVELLEAKDSLVILRERVSEEEALFAPLEELQNLRGRNAEYFTQKNRLFHAREAYNAMEMKVKFFIRKIEEDRIKQR